MGQALGPLEGGRTKAPKANAQGTGVVRDRTARQSRGNGTEGNCSYCCCFSRGHKLTTSKWYDKETEREPRARADAEQTVGQLSRERRHATTLPVPAHWPLQVSRQVSKAGHAGGRLRWSAGRTRNLERGADGGASGNGRHGPLSREAARMPQRPASVRKHPFRMGEV